jgi:hypothetical protein
MAGSLVTTGSAPRPLLVGRHTTIAAAKAKNVLPRLPAKPKSRPARAKARSAKR